MALSRRTENETVCQNAVAKIRKVRLRPRADQQTCRENDEAMKEKGDVPEMCQVDVPEITAQGRDWIGLETVFDFRSRWGN